ncbi:MAG: hypothetical protein ACFFG0_44130 [Candidatus Thorarchaeota archaeon]
MVGKIDFVFLAHPLDLYFVYKKYPSLKKVPKFIVKLITKHLWPVVGGEITGFKTKYNKNIKGIIIGCPLTGEQMSTFKNLAKKRVFQSVKLSEKIGAKYIGLGAFTSIVTNDGFDLINKFDINLTTGNTYATALLIANVERIVDKFNLRLNQLTLAIVGAGGSVGSAASKILAGKVKKIILIDKSLESLEKIKTDIYNVNKNCIFDDNLRFIKEAKIVITVTSAAGGIIGLGDVNKGTILIDCAHPKNVKTELLYNNNFLVIDSGIAKVPGIKYGVDIGLLEEEVYGCLGEVLTLMWHNRNINFGLGKVNPTSVEEITNLAKEAGLYVAPFRNSLGLININTINI